MNTQSFPTQGLEPAVARWHYAIQADPTNADHYNNLGIVHVNAGRCAEATTCFEQALRLRPSFPQACNNLSFAHYAMGRFADARAYGERALNLQPVFPEANNHLGLAHLGLGHYAEAAAQFRTALRLRPQLAAVHRNLAKALTDLERLDEAMVSFQEAIRLEPAFPEAHADLSEVFKAQGRFAEAVAHLRQALRIKPDYAFAWWNLGQFVTQGHCQFTEEEFNHVRAVLGRGGISTLDGSLLHLTLGDVLDRRGAFDAAFDHYRQAAALRKEWLRSVGQGFDPAAHTKMIDRVIATFDASFFRRERVLVSPSESPVFIVGMPRAGSTLVEQILASHSQMAGGGELTDIELMIPELDAMGQRQGGYPACMSVLHESSLQGLADRYLQTLAKVGGSKARVIDKMPENYLYLGVIALMFPRARVIHCRRDPLDVCLSCYFQNFNRINFSWSLEDLGHYHREYERLMAHWQRVLPLKMMNVCYEDVVARQEAASREMVEFCGLAWEERCLAFHANPRPVRTASVLQVRRPLYASSIGRWKNYDAHLEPLWRALGPSASSSHGQAASFADSKTSQSSSRGLADA